MENEISRQLVQAAAALAVGLAAGIFYDALRVLRGRTHLAAVTFFADLLFAVFCGALLFLCGLSAGQGRPRVFMTVLAVIGGFIYFRTLSPVFLAVFRVFADAAALLLRAVGLPLVFTLKILKKVNIFLKNIFQNAKKRYKIKNHNGVSEASRVRRKEHAGYEIQAGGIVYEDPAYSNNRIRAHHAYQPARPDKKGGG